MLGTHHLVARGHLVFINHRSGAVHNAGNCHRVNPPTAVGKHSICAGHFHQAHIAAAQR